MVEPSAHRRGRVLDELFEIVQHHEAPPQRGDRMSELRDGIAWLE